MNQRNTDEKEVTELVPGANWGSNPVDTSLSANLCKAIGIACIGIPAITILAVVLDIFILK